MICSGDVLMRVTLLAAGFVIGPSGRSIKKIATSSGASVSSRTVGADHLCPRDAREFLFRGTPYQIIAAVSIVKEAVTRYKSLAEGAYYGQTVPRMHKIASIEFIYQPPPRSAVPYAATLSKTPRRSRKGRPNTTGVNPVGDNVTTAGQYPNGTVLPPLSGFRAADSSPLSGSSCSSTQACDGLLAEMKALVTEERNYGGDLNVQTMISVDEYEGPPMQADMVTSHFESASFPLQHQGQGRDVHHDQVFYPASDTFLYDKMSPRPSNFLEDSAHCMGTSLVTPPGKSLSLETMLSVGLATPETPPYYTYSRQQESLQQMTETPAVKRMDFSGEAFALEMGSQLAGSSQQLSSMHLARASHLNSMADRIRSLSMLYSQCSDNTPFVQPEDAISANLGIETAAPVDRDLKLCRMLESGRNLLQSRNSVIQQTPPFDDNHQVCTSCNNMSRVRRRLFSDDQRLPVQIE